MACRSVSFARPYARGWACCVQIRDFGVRGDIRYFHSFQDLGAIPILPVANQKLDFGRAAAAIIFTF